MSTTCVKTGHIERHNLTGTAPFIAKTRCYSANINCLSKWYLAAAQERDADISDADAREAVYDMPYGEWKDKFEETKPLHAEISGHNHLEKEFKLTRGKEVRFLNAI